MIFGNNEEGKLPSSEVKERPRVCKIDDQGYCETHCHQSSSIKISVRKWRDRGGGKGFGWRTVKEQKFICKRRNSGPVAPNISSQNRFSDTSPERKVKTVGVDGH